MKAYLLAGGLLLAGCSGPSDKPEETKTAAVPAEDPTHGAVVAYLKKTLDDPGSYQPAEWGNAGTWVTV